MQTHSLWDSALGQQLEEHQWRTGEIEVIGIRVSAKRQLPLRQNSSCQAVSLSPPRALPHTELQSSDRSCPALTIT